MAQLELAHLPPATGTTAKAVGMGTTVETDGEAVAKSFSFSRLLQADAPENPAAAGSTGLATRVAASVTANPQAAQPGLEVVDPADLGKAGEQLMVVAVTEVLALEAGHGKLGEPKESATGTCAGDSDAATETGSGDSDTATGEMQAEAVWLGLPLFMDARAALRNVRSSGAEAAESTEAVDSARLRLMLCSQTVSGRVADNGRGSVRPTGEPVSEALAGVGVASTAPSAVAASAVNGLPASAPDSTARAASGDTMAMPLDGSAASLMKSLKAQVARPADSQPSVDSIAAAGSVAGVVTAVGVDETVAVEQPNGTTVRSDAPGAVPMVSTPAGSVGAIAAEEEGAAVDRTSAASDRPSVQPASGRPLQWRARLAETLARTGFELSAAEQSASAGNAATVDAAPRAATATALKDVGDATRSLPPAGQELSSLLIPNQANWRAADAKLATSLPEEASGDMVAIRAGEQTAPTHGGTPTQSISSPALARPDAAMSPASSPTTPDVLNLNQKNWERTLGHQLNWMVNNRLQEAEIKVNPPDLGPLEVRVSLHRDQTNVTFFSHEAVVREALENAIPRLREMLDGQGINLGQAQVSDQSLARQQTGAGEQPAYGQRDDRLPNPTPSQEKVGMAESRPRPRGLLGMVDDYA